MHQPAEEKGNSLGIHMRSGTTPLYSSQLQTADHSGILSAPKHSISHNDAYGMKPGNSVAENSGNVSQSAAAGTFVPLGRSGSEVSTAQSSHGGRVNSPPDEEDDDLDEEDSLDGDENSAQTPAERAAARRKMKRFRLVPLCQKPQTIAHHVRLTHQQTRFLMSEFAKQPHPDAAHRERLSREIPGLSSRQVQVWFQNRYLTLIDDCTGIANQEPDAPRLRDSMPTTAIV